MKNRTGIKGYVKITHMRGDKILSAQIVNNLITDAGDEYYAKKGIVGVSPANPSAPTAASGMKLGTGATAAAKSGAGAALGSYISGSNVVFDSSFPAASDAGSGWQATYKTTWPAGTATNSAITEAIICNDQSDNTASTAAETYARVTFSAVNKTADDSLIIEWDHVFLGA